MNLTPQRPLLGEVWMRFADRDQLLRWFERVLPPDAVTVTAIEENPLNDAGTAFASTGTRPLVFALGDPEINVALRRMIDDRKVIRDALALLERRNKADYQAAMERLREAITR